MCTSDEWHPILQSSFVPVPLLAAFEVYLRLRLSSKSREKLKNVNYVAFDFLSFVFSVPHSIFLKPQMCNFFLPFVCPRGKLKSIADIGLHFV